MLKQLAIFFQIQAAFFLYVSANFKNNGSSVFVSLKTINIFIPIIITSILYTRVTLFYKKSKANLENVIFPFLRP